MFRHTAETVCWHAVQIFLAVVIGSVPVCPGSLIVFDLLVHQTATDPGSSSTSVSEMVHTSDAAIVTSASGPPVNVHIHSLDRHCHPRLGGSVAEWLRRWTCNSQFASSIPGCGAVE